jgi:hypothetical protein
MRATSVCQFEFAPIRNDERAIVFKVFGSIAVIMLIAADVSLAPEAKLAIGVAAPNAALKGDRLDLGRRGAASACTWPQGAVTCEYEGTGFAGGVHKVQVVPINRVPTFDQRPAPDSQPHRSPQYRDRCASLPPSCGSFRGSLRSMT